MDREDAAMKTGLVPCCVLTEDLSLLEVGDDKVLDSSPVEASKGCQSNEEDEEKGAKKVRRDVLNTASLEKSNQQKVDAHSMDIDCSPLVLGQSQDSQKNRASASEEGTMTPSGSHVEESKQLQSTVTGAMKPLKRKRASRDGNMICQDKESLIKECRRELDEIFEYYKEVSCLKMNMEENSCSSTNSVIACLLEESELPYSKLVDEIYEKLKIREGITLSSVRSSVLFVGQRMMYGIPNADADVLEDESWTCLWCWETRDMKFLPGTLRGNLIIRRTARKKINERVSALWSTISVLSDPESLGSYKGDVVRAVEKLGKVLNGAGIRSLVERLTQKNEMDLAEKEAKLKEKELIKELERSKRSAEKEKKRIDRELEKEKLQSEKELKRQQEEAEKEARRREKEEADLKRQLKRQQEEAERDQRRREKEETELKKQISIQKQASMMQRFLKIQKSNNKLGETDERSPNKLPTSDSSPKKEAVVDASTSSMDFALSQKDGMTSEDLRKLHVSSWHMLSQCNRSSHWGSRRNPKTALIKNLKLQGSSFGADSENTRGLTSFKGKGSSERSPDNPVNVCEQSVADDILYRNDCHTGLTLVPSSKKKLLQFDKSHRPAYYGTWHKKSATVGPCHPFKKDPDLDYDIDSDEEWEEEEPGESLSDCDKDEEDKSVEEESTRAEDEGESEDSFVVPDGYLSENEGVQADSTSDGLEDEARSVSSCKPDVESDEFRSLLRHQKLLHNLTEQALRKSQPLIVSNLFHEKAEIIKAEDLSGTLRIEQICLQALCMRACTGGSITDASVNCVEINEDHEVFQSQQKNADTPISSAAIIPDSDLPEFVASIRAFSHGINKILESLQNKFPTFSRSQLKSKVREISDFVDNHWQVKKEVLDRIGLSSSQDKPRRPKGIAAFFSKRCLPPTEGSINSPEKSLDCTEKIDTNHHNGGASTRV